MCRIFVFGLFVFVNGCDAPAKMLRIKCHAALIQLFCILCLILVSAISSENSDEYSDEYYGEEDATDELEFKIGKLNRNFCYFYLTGLDVVLKL